MTPEQERRAVHEVRVIRAKLYAASMVRLNHPLAQLSDAELDWVCEILIDASIAVCHLKNTRPAPKSRRCRHLVVVAEGGEATIDGERILSERRVARERRRTKKAEVSG